MFPHDRKARRVEAEGGKVMSEPASEGSRSFRRLSVCFEQVPDDGDLVAMRRTPSESDSKDSSDDNDALKHVAKSPYNLVVSVGNRQLNSLPSLP